MSTLSKIFTDLEIFNPHFPNPLPFISTQSQKNHRSVFLPNNPQRSSIHHSSGAPDAPSGRHLLFLFLSPLFSFFLLPPPYPYHRMNRNNGSWKGIRVIRATRRIPWKRYRCYSVATAGLSADDDRIRRSRRARGRQEEAHEADVQRPANLRPRENVRADEIPSGAGTR